MSVTRMAKRERAYAWDPSRLRDKREGLGLTMGEVAGEIGVADATYANWEAGRFDPTASKLAKLATLFGIAPGFFFAHTDTE